MAAHKARYPGYRFRPTAKDKGGGVSGGGGGGGKRKQGKDPTKRPEPGGGGNKGKGGGGGDGGGTGRKLRERHSDRDASVAGNDASRLSPDCVDSPASSCGSNAPSPDGDGDYMPSPKVASTKRSSSPTKHTSTSTPSSPHKSSFFPSTPQKLTFSASNAHTQSQSQVQAQSQSQAQAQQDDDPRITQIAALLVRGMKGAQLARTVKELDRVRPKPSESNVKGWVLEGGVGQEKDEGGNKNGRVEDGGVHGKGWADRWTRDDDDIHGSGNGHAHGHRRASSAPVPEADFFTPTPPTQPDASVFPTSPFTTTAPPSSSTTATTSPFAPIIADPFAAPSSPSLSLDTSNTSTNSRAVRTLKRARKPRAASSSPVKGAGAKRARTRTGEGGMGVFRVPIEWRQVQQGEQRRQQQGKEGQEMGMGREMQQGQGDDAEAGGTVMFEGPRTPVLYNPLHSPTTSTKASPFGTPGASFDPSTPTFDPSTPTFGPSTPTFDPTTPSSFNPPSTPSSYDPSTPSSYDSNTPTSGSPIAYSSNLNRHNAWEFPAYASHAALDHQYHHPHPHQHGQHNSLLPGQEHLDHSFQNSLPQLDHSRHPLDHPSVALDHAAFDHHEPQQSPLDHPLLDHPLLDHSPLDHSPLDHSPLNHSPTEYYISSAASGMDMNMGMGLGMDVDYVDVNGYENGGGASGGRGYDVAGEVNAYNAYTSPQAVGGGSDGGGDTFFPVNHVHTAHGATDAEGNPTMPFDASGAQYNGEAQQFSCDATQFGNGDAAQFPIDWAGYERACAGYEGYREYDGWKEYAGGEFGAGEFFFFGLRVGVCVVVIIGCDVYEDCDYDRDGDGEYDCGRGVTAAAWGAFCDE